MNHVDMPGMDMHGMDTTTQSVSSNTSTPPDMTGMDASNMDTQGNDAMNMVMSYYHVGYKEFILFYELRTLSAGAMVGACFIIFAVAILYEGIKFLRDYLQKRLDPDRHVGDGVINSNYDNPFVGSSSDKLSKRATPRISAKRAILSGSHFLQTILHVLQVFISYCLMLIVMTFNVWLIIAVIAGAGVGYFLFGWMKHSTPEDEHNH